MSLRALTLTAGTLLAASLAMPATYSYANLTSDTLSGASAGSVTGTLATTNGLVNVTYSGEVISATQVGSGGTNYFTPVATFTNGTVSNAPTNGNVIALTGASTFTNTITFSAPVTSGVVLDLLSLGGGGGAVTYTFNQSFTVLSNGGDQWGSGPLTQSGNSITGNEGSGVIFFAGPVSSISFTTSGSEYWNGFEIGTLAPAAAAAPEPASLALMGSALVAVTFLRRRKA